MAYLSYGGCGRNFHVNTMQTTIGLLSETVGCLPRLFSSQLLTVLAQVGQETDLLLVVLLLFLLLGLVVLVGRGSRLPRLQVLKQVDMSQGFCRFIET